ncbi:MAG: NAD kinase [Cyclobacteriaceae bacterium]|nr:NAD kinase [Cyclobacteriaceae bacterium]
MKIAIHGKEFSGDNEQVVRKVLEKLKQKEATLLISDKFQGILTSKEIILENAQVFSHEKPYTQADVMITLGGDGTLLDAVTYIGEKQTPILGVNTGRLGFLATTSKDAIGTAFDQLFEGNYSFDDRTMICLKTNKPLFNNKTFALNDFTILKKDSSSMIVVRTYINGEFLNAYWADGLIVSTPTGSTGYSLSCGGPLVLPQSKNFVLTPVSPHNLTARPIVVDDDSEISFTIEGRNDSFLISLDSRVESIDSSVKLSIVKEQFSARLIKLPFDNYFDTLRQKLNWGVDVRN